MCELLRENKCQVLDNQCPYVYFCQKSNSWKASRKMPSKCKVKERLEVPKGYYKVCFQRHNNLYVDINGKIEIIPNSFEDVPKFVKATKTRGGNWRLKKYVKDDV